jgi:Tfp pilus assembly protein PilF
MSAFRTQLLHGTCSLIISLFLVGGVFAAPPAANADASEGDPATLQSKSAPGPFEDAAPSAQSSAPGKPPTKSEPEVTVTAPRVEPPLPALPPDSFVDCMRDGPRGIETIDYTQASLCERELDHEKLIVIDACANDDGNVAPGRAVQACTELLDHQVFEGSKRFFALANRARAYLAQGDKTRGLEDLNESIKLAPHNANLYYDRGLFYAAQPNVDAALHDLDTAIGLNSKLVPAFQQRARIRQFQNNLAGALSDYSEAIRLQPKSAALWIERGYVSLQLRDFKSAVSDETQAIRLDAKNALAFFLRGAAFGDSGDSRDASDDIKAAVNLNPLLVRYVSIQGRNASLTLPPL